MSVNKKPSIISAYDSDDEEERTLYFRGILLFNEHEFFAAHEVWEDVWNMNTVSGERARFYQGLIQVAVTLEHMCRNNPRGVKKVWRTMRDKFEGLPDVYMGMNVAGLLDNLHLIIEPVLNMPTVKGQQPGDVILQWDPKMIPEIKLEYDPFETGEV